LLANTFAGLTTKEVKLTGRVNAASKAVKNKEEF
jgi:hypothetical protein